MPDAPAAETATTEPTTEQTVETTEKLTPPPELQAIIDKERANAKEAEKARKALEKEVDSLRQQSMSDQEKAVALAKAEGRAEALAEVGGRVAEAELRAAAAGRMTDDQLATLTEGLNLAVFLNDAGEVDQSKVARFVDGIAPAKTEEPASTPVFPDLGQGARNNSTTALNGDPLLKAVRDKLGA